MDNRIRLRHLRSFVEVARTGSITRAAEAVNTVQPSLSRSRRELETEIGQALFERTGSGLVLTGVGETFLRHVGVGLAQIAKGVRQAQGTGDMGSVAVGILPNVARTLAPRAIARFKVLSSDTDVQVVFYPGQGLIDDLHEGAIEFILGRLYSPDRMKGLSFEHLYSEPLVFVARPDHPLAGRADVSLADIDDNLVLVPQAGTIIRQELDTFTVARGHAGFSNKIESISFEFVRAFLATEGGIACLPIGSVRAELGDGRLVRLAIASDDLTSSVGFSFVSGRDLGPAAARLADMIRQEAVAFAAP